MRFLSKVPLNESGFPVILSFTMTKAMEMRLLGRIRQDARVLSGKPVIAGTRISVEFILKLLAQGMSHEDVRAQYPRLHAQDIQAALLYAAKRS